MKRILSLPLVFLINFTCQVYATEGEKSCAEILVSEMTFLQSFFSQPPTQPLSRVHHVQAVNSDQLIKIAVFPSGTYQTSYDKILREQNYFAVIIDSVTEADISNYPDFVAGPINLYWTQNLPINEEAWIERAGRGAKGRNDIRSALRKTADLRVEALPLTLVDYELWNRELFVPEMQEKRGGMLVWPATGSEFLKKLGARASDSGLVENYQRIFLYDENKNLVAGAILMVSSEKKSLTIRAAVYNKTVRSKGAATRVVREAMALARSMGLEVLSYGTDPNLYNIDVTLGLHNFKASLGFTPNTIPGPNGVVRLQMLKILDTSLTQIDERASQSNSRPPAIFYYGYNQRIGLQPVLFTSDRDRDLKPQSVETPYGIKDSTIVELKSK